MKISFKNFLWSILIIRKNEKSCEFKHTKIEIGKAFVAWCLGDKKQDTPLLLSLITYLVAV